MKIDYAELQIALSFHDPLGSSQHYLDSETGEVLLISDWVQDQARKFDTPANINDESIRLAWYLLWQGGKINPELPKAEEMAMSQRIDSYLSRFLEVPIVPSYEAYQDMVDFAETVANPRLRELLEEALNGRGAFRRFKDVLLRYPEERERWFAFSHQCWRTRIDNWLQIVGIGQEG